MCEMIFISQWASLHFAFRSKVLRDQFDFANTKRNSYMDGMRIRVMKWRKSSVCEHDTEYATLSPSKMKMVHKTTVPRAF